MIVLWTWQAPDFPLFSGSVDPDRSPFAKPEPAYLPARAEIAALLRTDQFIWATKRYEPDTWGCDCVGYQLTLPKTAVLLILDGFLWNKRLGKRVLPPQAMLDGWKKEAEKLHPHDGQARRRCCGARRDGYWETPYPDNWLQQSRRLARGSEDPQFLIQHPLKPEWRTAISLEGLRPDSP